MKNLFVPLAFPLLLLTACKKEINTKPELEGITGNTISGAPEPSLDFDWENSNTVSIHGTNVTLPWIGGANTTIPTHILEDMKSANGWELYYNFPGWVNSGPNQNYLIFHNKFTGVLRVFAYNTIFTTDNSVGLFNVRVEGPSPTTILSLTLPLGQAKPQNNPVSVHTNISNSTYSGFAFGWNCFDLPLVYDPAINQSTKMKLSIYTDQRTVSDLTINGTFNAQSVGELVTTTQSNPLSGIVNSASTKGGELAKDWLKDKIQNSSIKSAAGSGILGAIINNAPNLLQSLASSGITGILSSFIGGFGTTSSTSQSITLNTEGKLNLSGQIITGNPGVINSFSSVSLPGTDYADGGFLPGKNNAFGSWGITATPIVSYTKKARGEKNFLQQSYYHTTPTVILNPAVADAIESYTVSSELWYYKKYQGTGLPDIESANNPNSNFVQSLVPDIANGETIYQDAENTFIRNASIINLINWEWVELRNPNYIVLDVNGYQPGFVVKVTVTMTPKAPYNTNPIIMTRSYIPTYQGIN